MVKRSPEEVEDSFCPIYLPVIKPTSFGENNNYICDPEQSTCGADQDCGTGKKCCYDGCSHNCVEPIKHDPYGMFITF